MGFLSKLMKNPLVQTALPFALSYAMGSPWAMKMGKWGMFDKMSPLMANALKQSALGYGTAALSGSKRPWKGAMYAGLTSIPFSYMSAANAANQFNQDYAGLKGSEQYLMDKGRPGRITYLEPDLAADFFPAGQKVVPSIPPKYGFQDIPGGGVPKVSAWDIMTGRTRDMALPSTLADATSADGILVQDPKTRGNTYKKLVEGKTVPLDASIFSKPEKLEGIATGRRTSDWLPTAVSQAAALYGGRDTPEEEWEAAKKKRRKELAWMYGVDEDMIEGEMQNPWYTGRGLFNSGGIASLDMSYGGDVSGPGTGTSDSIDAKLSDGEFVMTAKAVENFGGGDRYEGARKMYSMMNMLDPQSETMSEIV
jgi:hypothetical protein